MVHSPLAGCNLDRRETTLERLDTQNMLVNAEYAQMLTDTRVATTGRLGNSDLREERIQLVKKQRERRTSEYLADERPTKPEYMCTDAEGLGAETNHQILNTPVRDTNTDSKNELRLDILVDVVHSGYCQIHSVGIRPVTKYACPAYRQEHHHRRPGRQVLLRNAQ